MTVTTEDTEDAEGTEKAGEIPIPRQRPKRQHRLRALFSPDSVPVSEIDDVASDPYSAAWNSGYQQVAVSSFWTIARRLPKLLALTLRLASAQSRARVVTLLSLQVLSGIFQALGLFATTGVLTALFAGKPTGDRIAAALPSLVLIVVYTAASATATSVSSLMQSQLSPRMDNAALLRLQELCTRVELSAFDETGWFDAENRAERGAISPRYLLQATVRILSSVATLGSAIFVVALVHPLLLPLVVATIVPRWWAAIRVARMDYKVFIRQSEGRRKVNQIAAIGQSISQAPEVRALSLSDYLISRYRRMSGQIAAETAALNRAETFSEMLGNTLSGIAVAAVYALLALLLWRDAIPLAAGGTAVIAIGRAQNALYQLVSSANSLFAEGLFLDGYLEFCARAEAALPKDGTRPVPESFTEIAVQDVTFAYTGADAPALSGATLTIRRGQVVALVGENGAAKTTLAKLLGRLYLPDSGTIRWDGVDVADMDADELRSRIAYIGQDGARYPFTAGENIRVGDWRRRDEDGGSVQKAAEASGAHDFIAALPQGYRTLMDRSLTWGTNVSGGQHQRIALARGFYRQAQLVLADEPTSNLDAGAEIDFYTRLRSYGQTIVMVTHRLNAVQACADLIFVLRDGEIVASGSHEELMAEDPDGWYATSYLLQQNSFTSRADSEEAR